MKIPTTDEFKKMYTERRARVARFMKQNGIGAAVFIDSEEKRESARQRGKDTDRKNRLYHSRIIRKRGGAVQHRIDKDERRKTDHRIKKSRGR